jgi:hypothetical protein
MSFLSRTRKRSAAYLVLSLGVLLSSVGLGCGTPMAVKRLSAEQVKMEMSYLGSLKAYFDIIGKFADAQVQASDFRIDRLSKELEQEFKADAVKQLATATDEASRRQVLNDLTTKINSNAATAAAQKQKIADLVGKLKAKQTEMLDAYQTIEAAQQKLDEYIQLEKADEVAVNQLTGIVGVNKDKINQSVTDIANIADQVEKILGGKAATP